MSLVHMQSFPAENFDRLFSCMEVHGMETEHNGVTVLDEGIEDSLENAATCCKTGQPVALKLA